MDIITYRAIDDGSSSFGAESARCVHYHALPPPGGLWTPFDLRPCEITTSGPAWRLVTRHQRRSQKESIMSLSSWAGKSAEPSMLVNVPRLLTAYYTYRPDPAVPAQAQALIDKALAAVPRPTVGGGH